MAQPTRPDAAPNARRVRRQRAGLEDTKGDEGDHHRQDGCHDGQRGRGFATAGGSDCEQDREDT
jgi:hypothetical protein